jgi:hypothetical protein
MTENRRNEDVEEHPEIIMTLMDRFETVFTCTASDCGWARTAIGTPVSAEREALDHLDTHRSRAAEYQ